MDVIKNRFKQALVDFGIDRLIENSDRVIIGFSGGADSRVLLSFMNEYFLNRNKQIICAHVNHMIRGEEAFSDENKCVIWAQEIGVPIRVCRVNVPEIAKREGKGIEETARDERYRFFYSIASEFKGRSLIATAHNADDNLETVLFNLLRGSGTHGMSGIPPVRDNIFIRPLILCSSSSIREYCRKNNLEYNVDSTNTDTDYTRNYIRNNIVPLLKKINPEPAESILRMCSNLRTDDDFITSLADQFITGNGYGPQTAKELSSLHNAVLSRVIDRLYRSCGGKRALSKLHIDQIVDAIRNKSGSLSVCLPDGVIFSISSGKVFFESGPAKKARIVGKYHLEVDGNSFAFGNFAVTVSTFPAQELVIKENIYNLSIHKLTKFDKIKKDFFVRGRIDGDSYRFGNMTRKVKKLFSEKKIPLSERDSVPLLCDEEGIVWIPGFPLRDGASPDRDEMIDRVFICYYELKH